MPANEVEVRIGTSKTRLVRVIDKYTGEEKFIKVGPKPLYGPIGSKMKDGGKEF